MDHIRWERLAAILVCGAFGVAFGYVFLRVLLPILLPFLIAFGISLIVRPAAKGLHARFGGSVRIWSVVLLFTLLTVGSIGLWWSLRQLWEELRDLAYRLIEENGGSDGIVADAVAVMDHLRETMLGFLPKEDGLGMAMREKIQNMMGTFVDKAVVSLTETLPRLMGKILSALPNMFLILLVTVLSGFYFCFEGERLFGSLTELLPDSVRQRLPHWGARLKRVSFRYLKAYLWLFFLTVIELFIGFCVLRVQYALLLAIGIAFLDMLPVFGVGTALIPWAVVALLQKNFYLGFGLLILYAAVLLLRQITEPRLIGKSLGIHPVWTLFATYAGFRCFGILGMIIAPFVALLVKTVVAQLRPLKSEKQKEETKERTSK